jgi:hypothetical protein
MLPPRRRYVRGSLVVTPSREPESASAPASSDPTTTSAASDPKPSAARLSKSPTGRRSRGGKAGRSESPASKRAGHGTALSPVGSYGAALVAQIRLLALTAALAGCGCGEQPLDWAAFRAFFRRDAQTRRDVSVKALRRIFGFVRPHPESPSPPVLLRRHAHACRLSFLHMYMCM